jgi:hypothetical protein
MAKFNTIAIVEDPKHWEQILVQRNRGNRGTESLLS